MAFIHDWNRNVPSGDSLISQGDDLLRSDKSILEQTLNEEHVFVPGAGASANSAGIHRPGSARVHVGPASDVSMAPDTGRLMWAEDTKEMYYVGADGLGQLFSGREVSLRTVETPAEAIDAGQASEHIFPDSVSTEAQFYLHTRGQSGPSNEMIVTTIRPLPFSGSTSSSFVIYIINPSGSSISLFEPLVHGVLKVTR